MKKVSFNERARRSQVLSGVRLCLLEGYDAGGSVQGRLEPFSLKASFFMPEDTEYELPPPSAYEIEEAAYMMAVYHDLIIDRLRDIWHDLFSPQRSHDQDL